MNVDNTSKALTVYVGKTANGKNYIDSFIQKVTLFLEQAFARRKKALFVILIQFLLFLFAGACFSAKNNLISYYLNKTLLAENASTIFIFLLLILGLFSFSVFGKIITPTLCCICYFFVGAFAYSIYIDVIYVDNLHAFVLLSLFSFSLCLFSCESIILSQQALIGKAASNGAKQIFIYLLFLLFDIYSLYLILQYFIKILMVG